MRLPKLKLNKIKIFLKRLPKILGEYAFLTFLGLLLLALIFGGLIFYQYGISVQKLEPEVFEKPSQFKAKTFQKILEIWEDRQKRFEQTEIKEYPDLFRTTISPPAELME